MQLSEPQGDQALVTLEVPDMRDDAAFERVRGGLEALEGVCVVTVERQARLVVVRYDPKRVDLEALFTALAARSFRAHVVAPVS